MLLHLLARDVVNSPDTVKLERADWKLIAEDLEEQRDGDLEFICVSYSWGQGRIKSPFRKDFDVSDRTEPALRAVMRHRPQYQRIWIDAYCVPAEFRARNQTLQSMGYIYSQAAQVVVVLSKEALPALQQMHKTKSMRPEDLDILEKEQWVSRAWTYQEAVNSKELYFTCENAPNLIVDGSDFLNGLGYALTRLRIPGTERSIKEKYPQLDAFEDLIADFMISNYHQRSVLEVMSNMAKRTQQRSEDHFYAMMGAISTDCAGFSTSEDPCQAFMTLCQEKGDYSFLYCAELRHVAHINRWKPITSTLSPLICAHSWGQRQTGIYIDGSLNLHRMMILPVAPVVDDVIKAGQNWLDRSNLYASKPDLTLDKMIYAALVMMGFQGSDKSLSTTEGHFFPCQSIPDPDAIILISTEVQWSFGAPGLVQHHANGQVYYTAGVFFGRVGKSLVQTIQLI